MATTNHRAARIIVVIAILSAPATAAADNGGPYNLRFGGSREPARSTAPRPSGADDDLRARLASVPPRDIERLRARCANGTVAPQNRKFCRLLR